MLKECSTLKQKVLIVDDEESIVTLLKFNVETAGFATDVAYDGLEALRKIAETTFDFIILDIMLPKMDGMEVCKYLRERNIQIPILMLTARGDALDRISGLEMGADDYLTKPFSPREVVARIRAILRRSKQINEQANETIVVGEIIIYPEKHEVVYDGQALELPRMEFALLHYLAKHVGLVLGRDELLKEIWNYDFSGDTRIVDVHISRLREKIESDTKKPRYIHTVHGRGYKMVFPQG